MAISNCLFSPTSENPRGFLVWCVLAKLTAKSRTTHTQTVTIQFTPYINLSKDQILKGYKYSLKEGQ
jgi:hypothetical protein